MSNKRKFIIILLNEPADIVCTWVTLMASLLCKGIPQIGYIEIG